MGRKQIAVGIARKDNTGMRFGKVFLDVPEDSPFLDINQPIARRNNLLQKIVDELIKQEGEDCIIWEEPNLDLPTYKVGYGIWPVTAESCKFLERGVYKQCDHCDGSIDKREGCVNL